MESKGITYSDKLAKQILDSGVSVEFGDRSIFVIPPEIIALTKTQPYTYMSRSPRSQDLEDVRLLGVTQAQVVDTASKLGLII